MNTEEFEHIVSCTSRQEYHHISAVFPERSQELIAKLSETMHDPEAAVRAFTDLMLMSVAADGVLAIEEFMLLRPIFQMQSDEHIEYDEALQIFMSKGFYDIKNFRDTFQKMKEIYDSATPEVQKMIVDVGLLVCAADGKITDDEKIWLKNLAVDDGAFNVDDAIEQILAQRHSATLNRRRR